jgi:hypothetical protein
LAQGSGQGSLDEVRTIVSQQVRSPDLAIAARQDERIAGLAVGRCASKHSLFNLGVEIGQLAFIGVALVVMAGLRRLQPVLPGSWTPIARLAPAYGIGGVAAFWLLERFGTLGAAG